MARKKSVASQPLALGGNDEVEFHLEWSPGRVSAALDHLLYNGDLIDDGELAEDDGWLTLTFHRASIPVHRFQWSLLFPGKKLTDLQASAKINGKDAQLGKAKNAENRWADEGDWKGDAS